jgi:hypothetical protein
MENFMLILLCQPVLSKNMQVRMTIFLMDFCFVMGRVIFVRIILNSLR